MTQDVVKLNFSKLKGRIKEVLGSCENLAYEMGISNVSLSRKLNNKVRFTCDEIIHICIILDIPKEDIHAYFYVIDEE